MNRTSLMKSILFFCFTIFSISLFCQNDTVFIDWNEIIYNSKTTATLQVVVNPMLKRGSPIHKVSFEALEELGADFVRFVPWFPYPYAAVPQLRRPTEDSTFWDFSEIDPIIEDLIEAQKEHSIIMNFSTIPVWMFETENEVEIPMDKEKVFWEYNQGIKLRDTTCREVAEYYRRILEWYTMGGFTDELGRYHHSGYNYKFNYWEILNEPDLEHKINPKLYTRIYDEIVLELKKVNPDIQFIGMSLAQRNMPDWFEYFLNIENHKKGVSLDGISYHFYAFGNPDEENFNQWEQSFFSQANNFLTEVKYIENIRKRLSPNTFTDINELGAIVWDSEGTKVKDPRYWNLVGSLYAYLFIELNRLGIEIVGASQLVGFPSQFPSVSMMNWNSGNPNARYWVLKLINDHFGVGDKLVETRFSNPSVTAQAFETNRGRKLLLVNKTSMNNSVLLPESSSERWVKYVDEFTGDDPIATAVVPSNKIILRPFSVAVIDLD